MAQRAPLSAADTTAANQTLAYDANGNMTAGLHTVSGPAAFWAIRPESASTKPLRRGAGRFRPPLIAPQKLFDCMFSPINLTPSK